MIDYSELYARLSHLDMHQWACELPEQVEPYFRNQHHGDFSKWLNALEALPQVTPSSIDLNNDTIRIGTSGDCDTTAVRLIEQQLRLLHPWRKGPFELFGIHIDTEWRSDLKWNRLADKIEPLTNRKVLDVGCGSGYHCWRMAGAGADLIIGIDPTLLYVMQYQAIKHFAGDNGVFVLPLGVEEIPAKLRAFDTVFSMGVLYHRRSPLDHLLELKDCLRSNGELILETLVVDGELGFSLMPKGRYAKMRNVWFIPSCLTLELWLQRCGFTNIKLIDVSTTTIEEQRSTDWMRFDSLADFLMPGDPTRTTEGYPAPKRATFTANSP